MLRILAGLTLLLVNVNGALASPTPQSVPRQAGKSFVTSGLFEGGKPVEAVLSDVRLAEHRTEGFERWVVDFADGNGKNLGKVAPRFQLQYFPAEKTALPSGNQFERKPAKFLFFFRSIAQNRLTLAHARELTAHSQYVRTIHIYPPIEHGDMAIEFVLRDDVQFEPHQPVEKEGRLVLDLRSLASSP